jgi:solute carrier family 35 protein F5
LNSLGSFLSDVSWAYALLLTTPLIVTVGLSLTIPLSLIGEILQYGRYSSFTYWVGAVVVFLSFLIVNHESEVNDRKGNGVEEQEREMVV